MLSPNNSNSQSLGGVFVGRNFACKTAATSPLPPVSAAILAAGLGLQDGVYIPNHPRERRHLGGRNFACKTAALSPTTPQRPARCWRSRRRSGSTHHSQERRHLGGRNFACKTAAPSPPPPKASRMLALPGARTTPGSAAILAAGTSLARRRLHPHHPPRPAGCWRSRGRAPLPGAPPSWRQELRLQDGGSIPTTPGSAAILAAGTSLAGRRLHPHHPRERRHLGGRMP